jgi:hypothetical protein
MSDLTVIDIAIVEPAKFQLGRIVATPNALNLIPNDEILLALGRHSQCDWGDLGAKDKRANDRSVLEGARLLSRYETNAGIRFWIISEHDRSATTILLPMEY